MSEKHNLEELLKKAAARPEDREAFYKALMESSVYVVGRQEPQPDGSPAHVQLKQWEQPDGRLAVPFFATPQSLRELLGDEEPCLELPVVELFKAAGDVTMVLTTSGGSKAFHPDEVAALLSSVMALDPLAKALVQAIEDGADKARHNFYNVLINSQVFVLGRPRDESAKPGQGSRRIQAEDQFLINTCPHPFRKDEKVLPFFSSMEHLRRVAPPKSDYMGFAALYVLDMARQMKMQPVLNLGFQANKIFADEEVDFLLNSAAEEPFEQRHYAPGSKVYLSQPEKYPQEMVRALLDFLPAHPEVKAAYLAIMREDSEEAAPVMVIGFETDDDVTAMFRKAGPLVSQYVEGDMPIDFARVTKGEKGLSQYFLDKVSPFYLRAMDTGERQNSPLPSAEKPEKYDSEGFFGRLKRIFSGSAQ